MRVITRLERFQYADIRRLLSGIVVTVGFVVLLVQCFGIPCRKAFCLTTSSEVSVVKTEVKYVDVSNDDARNGYEDEYEKEETKKMYHGGSLKWRWRVRFLLGVKTVEKKPRWSSARDSEMLSARSQIEKASFVYEKLGLNASIYRNISKFQRSYDLMERKLKVYVYKEGEKPIFHKPTPRGIYASEGWFLKLMESNKKFVVTDPRKAHLFYIPISIRSLRTSLGRDFNTPKSLADHFEEYVDSIASKYKFWNRTGGADHFLVACHDWGNKLTKKPMKNSVRSLCNSNVAQGFRIGTDTALPVTYIRSAESPLEYRGGKCETLTRISLFRIT